MSNRQRKVASVLSFMSLFFLVFLIPSFSSAQAPLVQCGVTDPLTGNLSSQCQLCDLVELIQRVINFIIVYLAAPVATLLLAWAGIRLMVYAENETERTNARQLLKDILIGFLWILLAWTVVMVIMNALVDKSIQGKESKWFNIRCEPGYGPPNIDLSQSQVGLDMVPVRPGENVTCANCQAIPTGVPIKSVGACATGYTCQISQQIVTNVIALKTELETSGISTSEWQINEVWPPTGYTPEKPTGIHQNRCHGYGTCIDAGLANPTPENIAKFSVAADKAQMRAVYEVKTQAEADTLKKQLPASVNVAVVSEITGAHFSVYKK